MNRSNRKPAATADLSDDATVDGDLDFTAAGFFSDGTLYPMRIKVGDVEGVVYVRKLPVTDLRRFQLETASPDDNVRMVSGLNALVKSIRREDGSPHMTFEQAKKLKASAVAELMRVFVAVNMDKSDDDAGNA